MYRPGTTTRPCWRNRRLGAYGLFLCLASAYTLVVHRHVSNDDGAIAKSWGVATGQVEWNEIGPITTTNSGEVATPISGGRSAQESPRPSSKDVAIKPESPLLFIASNDSRAVIDDDNKVLGIDAGPNVVHRRRRKRVHVPAEYISADVPIRIVDPSINETSVLNWSLLSKSLWNETTTFGQLLKSGNSSALPSIGAGQRAVVILHLSPKMGSLTLRFACKNLLKDKCQVENEKRKDPPGYDNVTELSKLIVRCKSINHFCLMRDMFDPGLFEDIAFLHLYPFRQYDEWTLSAHKMPFDRGGEKLCAKMKALFDDDCRDEHGELSFRKYPKVKLSDFRSQIAYLQDRSGSSSHHIILHDFKDVDRLLSLLSVTYRGLGRMLGSDKKYHATNVRKKGTCDMKILDKYHECFSKDLINL